ncbi:MAG: hypothetical protein IJU76_08085 [Desulfovibrionaceae bacterium]|nr:hypothetical protein [Desulfovibrionaceae bacterium]
MWVALENKVKQARDEGLKEGREKGYKDGLARVALAEKRAREKATVDSIQNLMDSLGIDVQKAMNALKVPVHEQEHYAELILSSSL